jgi:hypothetical protein
MEQGVSVFHMLIVERYADLLVRVMFIKQNRYTAEKMAYMRCNSLCVSSQTHLVLCWSFVVAVGPLVSFPIQKLPVQNLNITPM